MGKSKLSEDEIKWILSVDSSEAQQNIHKLSNANRELAKTNKERSTMLRELEAQGKKESEAYRNLEAEIKATSKTIAKNNSLIGALEKKLDVTGLTMSQLKKKAKDLRVQLDSTVKATHPEEYATLEKELGRVTGRMDELRSSGKKVAGQFPDIESGISKLKAVAVAFITVKLAGYLKDIAMNAYETRKEFAKYEAVLRNTFQSQEKATKAMKMLQTLAAETPSSLKDWTEAYIKLVNRGLNPTRDELIAMGDLTASQGKDIDQFIEAVLDAMTGENERLKEFGIKASKNGDKVKYTFRGVTTEVNNSEESIKNYLISLGQMDGVVGSMAVQMQELAGMESNLGDTMDSIYNKIGKKFEPMLKSVMGGLVKFMGSVSDSLDTASEAYDRQREKTVALETTMPGLLSKYEELTSKTSLSKEEQKELRGVIDRITTMVPGAATAFDQYGTAISISTSKVREFIDEQKAMLKYQNQEAIKEAEKNIKHYKEKLSELQREHEQGGKTVSRSSGFSGSMYSAPISYIDKNTFGDIKKEMKDYGDLLKGAELDLERLNGDSVEQAIETQQQQSAARDRFLKMNKQQLESWLKDEKNAADQYRDIAEEILKSKNGTTPSTGKDKSDPNAVALKKLESSHQEELNKLRLNGQEKQQLEGQTNLEILNSDKSYYEARISMLQQFQKNEKKSSKAAGYENQVVEAKSKLLDLEKSIDTQRLDQLAAFYKEDSTLQQQFYDEQKRYLKTQLSLQNLTQEQYDALILSLDQFNSENRLLIAKNYLESVSFLEVKNGQVKAEAVKLANVEVLKAENEAADSRMAIASKLSTLVKDFKDQFKLTTVDEDYQAQLKVIEGAYQARKSLAEQEKVDTTELDASYYRAKEQLEQNHEDKILQVRRQYGLVTQQEDYNAQLALLKQYHEQGYLEDEQYEQAVQNLKRDSFKKQFDYYSQLFGGAINALQEAEMANVDAKYDAEIEAAQGNAAEVERLEKEKAQKKLDIEKKYADVNFAVKASQIIADTAVSIMKALADLGPIAGPIAAALMGVTGAAQLAAANAERKKVKNMTLSGSGSSSSGGYTRVAGKQSGGSIDVQRSQDGKLFPDADFDPDRRGFIDKPTVIVGEGPSGKSKEWVASNDAVGNPTIAPFLNILDHAQQAGTIRTLDLNKVIQVRMAGFSSGGSISPQPLPSANPTPTASTNAPKMNDVLSRFCDIMDRLEETGLPAYTLLDEFEKTKSLRDRSRKLGSKS